MKIKILTTLLLGLFLGLGKAHAQEVALKTNLLYWGTTTPNLAVEIGVHPRMTVDVVGSLNLFEFGKERKLKHWLVQPEFRLWNCEKFNRGFWGAHLQYGIFNVSNLDLPTKIFPTIKGYRLEGSMFGGGISYGYQWYLGPHWNIEATFGFGYLYLDYKRYECGDCGSLIGKEYHHYWGPTKIGVTFVYLFKSKK